MFYKDELYNSFENGIISFNDKKVNINELPWNPSPAYKGVSLKHVITGSNTNNYFSIHLVKIEPGCEIGLHNHLGKTELHEVMAGEGLAYIEESEIQYKTGVISLIPADKDHLVKAGDDGLYLFAKFFPALI